MTGSAWRNLAGIGLLSLALVSWLPAADDPQPPVVDPGGPGGAPSDAIALAIVGALIGGVTTTSASDDSGASDGREIVNFDLGWRFTKGEIKEAEKLGFDDSKWRQITLPHDWSVEDLAALPPTEPTLSVTKGTWRFSKGDDLAWKELNLDDSKWLEVELPAAWDEYAQYKDNQTYGWLRRKFSIPEQLKGRDFLLATGWIKDVDETFVNGVKVGATGSFPPEFRGAKTTDRYYRIPADLVKGDGTDVVAVRVYREGGWGGGIFYEQMPHTRSGPFDTKADNGSHTGYTVGGTGWYRKRFTVPTGREGDRVRIQFGGVYQDADVWINGHHLGNHPYGYTSFGFDLTPHLDFGGVNVLVVRARNLDENSRWYSGSGIYRHVRLIYTESVHVVHWGTFVTTPEVSDESARVKIQNKVVGAKAGAVLRVRIRDAAGKVLATTESSSSVKDGAFQLFDQQLELANPQRWSLETPNLYTAICDVMIAGKVVDSVSERFGIRTITMNAKDGFKLNGKSMLLKGSCMHHDNGPLGAAAYDDAEHRRVRLTKEAGFNAIRCSHNPPSEAFLDACDELGMLVIDEAFDIWKHGKGGSRFYSKHFDEWWQRDLEAMILRDRNHPSVIMWSTGNEIPQNDTEAVFETARMLADHTRKLDPTRPVTSGVQGVNPKKDGFFDTLDVSGYNYSFKWNEGHTYETDAYVDDHKRHPDRIIYGAESFSSHAFDYWMAAVDHSWVLGDFVWTGWDYLGESSIGWIGFGYPVYWPTAYCGDISVTGVRQPQSYYRGALFGDDTVAAFVQSPEPSFPHYRRFDWGSPDVQASWTWPGMEGKRLGVRVYSSCEEVELFLNDRSLGKQPTNRESKFKASFGVAYEPGVLKAVGYNAGQAISEWILKTAGEPAAIRLSPERTEISADGQSLVYVPFEMVDAKGTVQPQADNLVHFKVRGPAIVAAVGNGDPSSLESFQQPQRRAWRGSGLVILRSTGEPGRVELTATSDGLEPATVSIGTK